MEIKVLEKSKTKLVFELIGEDHTLCNAIKEELNTDSSVKMAAYKIEHPSTSQPVLFIEADDAPKALDSAIKRAKKNLDDLEKLFKAIK